MQTPPVTLSSIELYFTKYKLKLFNLILLAQALPLIKALLFVAFINIIFTRYILNNKNIFIYKHILETIISLNINQLFKRGTGKLSYIALCCSLFIV